MKNIHGSFAATLAASVLLGVGCTNNVEYRDVGVWPVTSLGLPADGAFIEMQTGTDKFVDFSWSPGSAEDGDPVQYELVFMGEPGGEEVSVMDARMDNSVRLTHKDLNRVMGLAGTGSGETGSVYWTVRSSRGPNSADFDSPHKLNIRRMLGFDDIPARLFLTGAASETGADLAAAREFRMTSAAGEEGEFEMYAELGAGTYNMVSATDGAGRTFGIVGGLLEETAEATVAVPGIYRINVDFTVKGATLTRIESVTYAYMQNTAQNRELEYAGGGRWQLLDMELQFARPGWGTRGFEERYRFEVVTAMQNEVWGPADANLDGAPSALNWNSDYFTTVARARTDDWNPKWKWFGSVIPDLNEAGGTDTNPWKRINLYVDMSGGRYYHHYEVLP